MFGKVKAFLLWLLIVLIINIFYVYQNELQQTKHRLVASLIPGYPTPGDDANSMCIAASDDGHFHVIASVNGHRQKFLVDTGASTVSFNIATAKALGINVENLIFNEPYQTANGKAMGSRSTLENVQVGDITIHNVPAMIAEGMSDEPLLGMSFLNKLSSYYIKGKTMCMIP